MIYDFAILGGGIAGASLAYRLAEAAKVVILEMERQPGYHSTGRSAAMFAPNYGPKPIRALSRASLHFFENPPEGFADAPLLSPRGILMLARADQMDRLKDYLKETVGETDKQILDASALSDRFPLLRDGYAAGGIYDCLDRDLDVHALHQGFLKGFKKKGGAIICDAKVNSLKKQDDLWAVETKQGTFQAHTLINATGAWADEIGKMAGAEPIDLVSKRRTAMIVDAPAHIATDDLPLIVDIDEEFYLKPDAGRLLISPANEDPTPAQDVQPEEMDIAFCLDRIEKAFELEIRQIGQKWAGLRSFVADKCPVVGYSHRAQNFFWLAGQGGYGIQTSPGLSDFAASLLLDQKLPDYLINCGVSADDLAPYRLKPNPQRLSQ